MPTENQGYFEIDGQRFNIPNAKLIIYTRRENGDTYREILLEADAQSSGGGFFMIDCVPLSNVSSLDDLDEGRIHGDMGMNHDDDTLGSPGDDSWETSGYSLSNDEIWYINEILADFKRIEGNQFAIDIEASLFSWQDETPLEFKGHIVADATEEEA